jgi:hypothetical protein
VGPAGGHVRARAPAIEQLVHPAQAVDLGAGGQALGEGARRGLSRRGRPASRRLEGHPLGQQVPLGVHRAAVVVERDLGEHLAAGPMQEHEIGGVGGRGHEVGALSVGIAELVKPCEQAQRGQIVGGGALDELQIVAILGSWEEGVGTDLSGPARGQIEHNDDHMEVGPYRDGGLGGGQPARVARDLSLPDLQPPGAGLAGRDQHRHLIGLDPPEHGAEQEKWQSRRIGSGQGPSSPRAYRRLGPRTASPCVNLFQRSKGSSRSRTACLKPTSAARF